MYMSPIFRILIGLVVTIVGFLMVWKTYPLQGFIGRIDWAEDKLGPGGTNPFLKLLGIVVAFIGIFIMTNIISDILNVFTGIFIRK